MDPAANGAGKGRARTEADAHTRPKCARCGAEMEEGYLQAGPWPARALRWIAGVPAKPRFLDFGGSLGASQKKVSSYRCSKCGYLESYAL